MSIKYYIIYTHFLMIMDLAVNTTLLKAEIILMFSFLVYSIYYLCLSFVGTYNRIKLFIKPQRLSSQTSDGKQQSIPKFQVKATKNETKEEKISRVDQQRLNDLMKRIRLNISRSEYDLAKNLIVEWLTINKFHKWLNLELASIYLLENDFIKAEYIYRDILLVHDNDYEILKKLGYVLSAQEKYDLSIETYKKAFGIKKRRRDPEIVWMLSHLLYTSQNFVESIEFTKLFLKDNPRDIETLFLLAFNYKNIWKYADAKKSIKKILEIAPYHEEAQNELEELIRLQTEVLEPEWYTHD